jgi:hypothetical protein
MESNSDSDLFGLGVDDNVIIAMITSAVSAAVVAWATSHYDKKPLHNSAMSGIDFVDEVIDSHEDRIKIVFGVCLHVFKHLLHVLQKMGYTDGKVVPL